MHDTIAVIHVETQRESPMSDDQSFTRMFKLETPLSADGDADEDSIALWEYNNGGYGYLESLGTTDIETAIEDARTRVEHYILNEELLDLHVTMRD